MFKKNMDDERKTKIQLIQELTEARLLNTQNTIQETRRGRREQIEELTNGLFKDLVEYANDLIQIVSPEGLFIYVNRAWLKTFGYSRKEVRTLSLKDIVHPDSRKNCHTAMEKLLSGKKVHAMEMELITNQDKTISVEVTSRCKFHNGNPLFIQCIIRDITKRKEAELNLQNLEAMEFSILSAIPHAVLGLRERTIIFANESVKEVFGWKPDEIVGKRTRILYRNKDEYIEIGTLFYSVLERQKTHSEDFICRRKDGRDILCRVSAAVIGNKLQNKEIVVMYEDITESKRIEEALKESEMKYIDLYENAPDGYHSLGPDGTILDVNTTWLKMLGYKRDEIIRKKKFIDILSDEQKGFFRKNFRILKEKGSIQNIEYMLVKKDGTYLPVIIGATAIYDEKGKFIKTRTIVRDISARTNYKKMLEQTVEEWRITFDSMPYGVLLIDMNLKIKRGNKYFSSLYDIPFQEIRGKKCHEVLQSDELRKRFAEFSSSGTIDFNTFEYYDKHVERTLMLYLTPVPGAQGLTSSFVLALVDISDLKDKEKRIADSRDAFFNMLKELDFSYKELKGLYEGIIHSFVNAIDAKSPWTKGHSERVTRYAVSIAEELQLDDEQINNLRIAALLHDIGKIGTYDVILDNPQKLSAEEIRLINLHPVKGEQILKPIRQLHHLMPIIRHHHERIDGKGYPDKLKGDKIPFLARILCIADSYDSMTSDRPYRPAKTKQYAISELTRCRNTQFDAQAVNAFLSVLART